MFTHLSHSVESHPSARGGGGALLTSEQHLDGRDKGVLAELSFLCQRLFIGATTAAAGAPKDLILRAFEISPCFGYLSHQAVADEHSDRPPLKPPADCQVFRRPRFFVVLVARGAAAAIVAVVR